MVDENALKEENRRIRQLRLGVELAIAVIMQTQLDIDEALDIVNGVRKLALRLFPGSEDTFDLIYLPRFRRVLRERFGQLH